ncbi:MAG: radical SAM family heme chaperone HemW [Flavobacteriales bacterium]|nr:radical SAM family heme chaperone HemW [Flavobacteriales bacterium]
MAGIYIHIPFCKQACSYCDFHFSTNLSRKQDVINAILQEIKQRKNYLKEEPIETIYLGGGTPSLLNLDELTSLFDALHQSFEIHESAEITLEANPDDLTKEKLIDLKQTSINRLSIGVQPFFEEDLRFMNRAHSAIEAVQSIKDAQHVGFEQISIDLIFGSQTTTNKMWESNLDQFFELNISHLSAYSLTIEEKTALANKVDKGLLANVDDEKNYTQYLMLQTKIKEQGYEQYELSNYCKNSAFSKHNSSYWFGKQYLGIGPSAHSFDGNSRQWNIRNNALYCKALKDRTAYFEKETLTEIDRYHEYLITSLRTKWGVSLPFVQSSFSSSISTHFSQVLHQLDRERIILSDERLSVKNEFLFQSDEVVRSLMIDKI